MAGGRGGSKAAGGGGGGSRGSGKNTGGGKAKGGQRGKKTRGGRGGGRGGSTAPQYGKSTKEERRQNQRNKKAEVERKLEELEQEKRAKPQAFEEAVTHVRNALSGEIAPVKDLSRHWLGEFTFFEYLPLDNKGPETLEVLQYLNQDVAGLLASPYKVFWSYVLLDKAFQLFLDSFLRYFQAPSTCLTASTAEGLTLTDLRKADRAVSTDDDVQRGLLFERVFLVVCRMARLEEADGSYMGSAFYTQSITADRLLDLAKLVDFARLYTCYNRKAVTDVLRFAFYQMPSLKKEFGSLIAVLAAELERMAEAAYDMTAAIDMAQVLESLLDLVGTTATFVDVAPNVVVHALRSNLLIVNLLVYCHDAIVPQIASRVSADAYGLLITRSNQSVASLFHSVLQRCLLAPLLQRRDKRGFEPDSAAGQVADMVLNAAVIAANMAAMKKRPAPTAPGSLLAALDATYDLRASLQEVASTVPSQVEKLHEALGVIPARPKSVVDENPAKGRGKGKKEAPEGPGAAEDAEWTTKRLPLVKMVQEIVGDSYGEGFVDRCLQHYNDSVEQVVSHIFDGSLHESLQALDQAMSRSSVAAADATPAAAPLPSYSVQQADDFGEVAHVHYGKKSRANVTEVPDDVKGFAKKFSYTYQEDRMYDDEWDDTYDRAVVKVSGDQTVDEAEAETEAEAEAEEDTGDGDGSQGGSEAGNNQRSHASSKNATHKKKLSRKKLAAKKRAF